MPSAARILSGGPILTMDDGRPTAEAVAVGHDGRILAVGTRAEVEALADGSTERTDLAGRTLMPGFVDGHCHLLGFGVQAVGANLLNPPDGTVETVEDVVAALTAFAEARTATGPSGSSAPGTTTRCSAVTPRATTSTRCRPIARWSPCTSPATSPP